MKTFLSAIFVLMVTPITYQNNYYQPDENHLPPDEIEKQEEQIERQEERLEERKEWLEREKKEALKIQNEKEKESKFKKDSVM